MSGGEIRVDYQTIVEAGDHCSKAGGQLKDLFDQLKSQLNPLVSTWQGDAQEAYQQRQHNWDKSFEEMTQVLAQIATALPQIAESYQSTEGRVTRSF
jgi:early secretory antigenic target protein ESAT-6